MATTTTMIYDAAGNLISETTGQSTTAAYAHPSTTSYAYDAQDRETDEIDAYGTSIATTTTMIYDPAGNLLSETTGQSTTTAYANPSTTSYSYDALNRQVEEMDAYGTSIQETTSTVYDAASNVVQSYDGLGYATTYGYDALNRQTTVQTPAGGTATTDYDAAGNVLAQIDQLGHATSYSYNALNRQLTTTNADGYVTTMAYDAAGDQISVTDADGNTTTMGYDALGRMASQTNPLGDTATYAYDAAGNLLATTDYDGRLDTYAYDALDRQTGVTWKSASGTVTDVQTFTYDAAGNQLTAADFSGAYTMTYNALDQMTAEQEPYGLALTFAYDAAGNRVLVQDSLGGVTTSVYNALGNLTTREFGGSGQTTLREDLTYNADNQIATETRYDDLAGTVLAGTSSYVYDSDDRLVSLTQFDPNGNVLASYTYSYDEASRLTSEADDGAAPITYTYDAANQLIAVSSSTGTVSYSYDATGNPAGDTIGPNNQLLNDGTWTYTYDAEGDLVEKSQGPSSITWFYTYNNDDQLLTATEMSAASGGTLLAIATYAYDVFGNQIASQEWNQGIGESTTSYAYDRTNAWATLNGSGQLQTRQLYLDGPDQLLASINGAGTAQWFLTDRQGSVRDLIAYAGTMVLDQISYDAFGNITAQSNPADQSPYQYDSYRRDALTGMYQTTWRQYDPGAGRWTSQDPIGFLSEDSNLYRYVSNNPTNATDPFGEADRRIVISFGQQPTSYWSWYLLFQQPWVTRYMGPSGNIFREKSYIRQVLGIGSGNPNGTTINKISELILDNHGSESGQLYLSPDRDEKYVLGDYQKYLEYKNEGANNQADAEQFALLTRKIEFLQFIAKHKSSSGLNLIFLQCGAAEDGPEGKDLLRELKQILGRGITITIFKGNTADFGYMGTNGNKLILGDDGEITEEKSSNDSYMQQLLHGSGCFTGGTPVLTPAGQIAIEQLKEGDLVLSRSEFDRNGPIEPRRVERVFVHENRVLRVCVGGQMIETTPGHPFYTEQRNWILAIDLKAGDRLLSHDGEIGTVENLIDTGEQKTVYNLQVNDYRTYFVRSGSQGLTAWVHNTSAIVNPFGGPPVANA